MLVGQSDLRIGIIRLVGNGSSEGHMDIQMNHGKGRTLARRPNTPAAEGRKTSLPPERLGSQCS